MKTHKASIRRGGLLGLQSGRGTANRGTRTHSTHDAPSYITGDQIHLPTKQLVLILSVLLLPLINGIEPQGGAREAIVYVLIE